MAEERGRTDSFDCRSLVMRMNYWNKPFDFFDSMLIERPYWRLNTLERRELDWDPLWSSMLWLVIPSVVLDIIVLDSIYRHHSINQWLFQVAAELQKKCLAIWMCDDADESQLKMEESELDLGEGKKPPG